MINSEDEVSYDLRSSCTEEEAAAMILGWLRGERRARHIQVTLDGINPDQFPYLPSLPDTLEATIHEQREKASIEFHNAVVKGEFAIAAVKEAIVEDWDEFAKRARRYMIDIGDELTKSDSALRIDQRTSIATGVTHVTLKSLDQWSRKEYRIAILDDEPQGNCTVVPPTELIEPTQSPGPRLIQQDPNDPDPQQPLAAGVTQSPKKRRFDALAAELDEILEKSPDSSPSKIMAKLRDRIGKENTCVLTNMGDGIQWEDNKGNVKTLKLSALTERVRNLKDHRLIQG
ncbi:MAG: hypothetical protein WA049_08000 [Ferribacterium limneticum]